jgi:hypothetical protein
VVPDPVDIDPSTEFSEWCPGTGRRPSRVAPGASSRSPEDLNLTMDVAAIKRRRSRVDAARARAMA